MEIIEYSLIKNNQALTTILRAHQLAATGNSTESSGNFSYAAFSNGAYLGGISGNYWLNTLHISLLAVLEQARNQGVATQLLNHAKSFAEKQKCRYLTINTQDFQAKDFYQHYGFTILASVADMPFVGTTKYFMLLDLTAEKEKQMNT